MQFYFHPEDDNTFKKMAVNNYVQTIVFDMNMQQIIKPFSRKVNKVWEQTRKNNVESDHRIKKLRGGDYIVYSWVVKDKHTPVFPCFFHDN